MPFLAANGADLLERFLEARGRSASRRIPGKTPPRARNRQKPKHRLAKPRSRRRPRRHPAPSSTPSSAQLLISGAWAHSVCLYWRGIYRRCGMVRPVLIVEFLIHPLGNLLPLAASSISLSPARPAAASHLAASAAPQFVRP